MALVGTRVHRDAIGTLVDTELGKRHHIGIVTLAGIADQGDFIEVNTEIGHIIARKKEARKKVLVKKVLVKKGTRKKRYS
jgi:hypothetical protein